jgi:hypothetical protein
MADPTTPGDAADNAKTDASNEADNQKAGTEKDGADAANQGMSDAGDSATKVAKGGNVGDAGKDLAKKEEEQVKAKAKEREEAAKKAAIDMVKKNAEIAKQMAIQEAKQAAMNELGSLLGGAPGLTKPDLGDLGGLGNNLAPNALKNPAQKLTDIKPSEPSV